MFTFRKAHVNYAIYIEKKGKMKSNLTFQLQEFTLANINNVVKPIIVYWINTCSHLLVGWDIY